MTMGLSLQCQLTLETIKLTYSVLNFLSTSVSVIDYRPPTPSYGLHYGTSSPLRGLEL